MDNTMTRNNIFLDLSIDDDEFGFSTSIADALTKSASELIVLNETVDSIKDLKPNCDKLDYILAASSGALCGIIDIFLVGKPGSRLSGMSPISGLQPEQWTLQNYAIQIKRISTVLNLHYDSWKRNSKCRMIKQALAMQDELFLI